MNRSIHVFAVIRESQKYVFTCDNDPRSVTELLATFRQFAADPELDFTPLDAAILSAKVRKEVHVSPQ